jgi:hypothetical protein
MRHPVLQWQFVSPRAGEAAEFYSRLFGWQVRTDNALDYRQVPEAGTGVAGGFWPAPSHAPSFVQLFFGCENVAETVSRALQAGADVIVPVTPLPDGDVLAILRDPFGVSFGLMQMRASAQP